MASNLIWHHGIMHIPSCPCRHAPGHQKDSGVRMPGHYLHLFQSKPSPDGHHPSPQQKSLSIWVSPQFVFELEQPWKTDVFLLILFVLCSGHTRSHWAAGNPSRTWSHKRNGVCVEPSDWGLLLASLHCWAHLIYLNRMDYEGEDARTNTFFFKR